MRVRVVQLLFLLPLGLVSAVASAQTTLAITAAQPTGELASLEQAAEIRVRFSEAMVPIRRIPDQVTAPFFSTTPAVQGTFRWAGPTLLVFTPDPKKPLPHATRYEVTIAAGATAVSGRRLAQPYSFAFTTPTVRLLNTNWYRIDGRFDKPVVIVARFNQPVRASEVVAHASARYTTHQWTPPPVSAEERTRMGAQEAARFDAKVAAGLRVAASQAPIRVQLAPDWDKKQFPPAPDLVVLQTVDVPVSGGWVTLAFDTGLPAIEGRATPPRPQSYVIQVERPLFVERVGCKVQCDGDGYNGIEMSSEVRLDALRQTIGVQDITDRARETRVTRLAQPHDTWRSRQEVTRLFSLEDVGFDPQPPARTYAISLESTLQAADGQTLGYRWTGIVENWHSTAFSSFGDGHGVWEKGGGPLPFYARNLVDARQWASALSRDQLMPTIVSLLKDHFSSSPSGPGVLRRLGGSADKIESHGLDLSSVLSPGGTGLVWAALKAGAPIERARSYAARERPVASVVQVTNLGITVKDSPQSTLVFVTRLDTGAPVAGADVNIIKPDNSTVWSGKTDAQGIALAPQTRLRDPRLPWKFSFVVTAAKDGDIAYVGSDWNEGIEPYMLGASYTLAEAEPVLRGTVFSDRGVYKLGEEVHLKAVLRKDTTNGIQLIAAGTPLYVALRDGQNRIIARRTVALNGWSTTEWVMTLPADGDLGRYQATVSLDKQAVEDPVLVAPKSDDDDVDVELWQPQSVKTVTGGFLVAAYRRPEFRVDASLAADVKTAIAGAPLKGVVSARYLFGAAMTARPVSWRYSRSPIFQAPAAVEKTFPPDRFTFIGCCDETLHRADEQLLAKTGTLDAKGTLALDLDTQPSDGYPYQYSIEGDVEDVSRQHIANHAAFVVHPAPWYIGLKRPSLFVEQKNGLTSELVAVSPDGVPISGVDVDLTLVQVQWNSVRRAEGNGFYTWDVQRKEVPSGHLTVTTGNEPVPFTLPLPNGGSFFVRAEAHDGELRSQTRLSFYALGSGYTAWARYDHNRIDIVPERETYKPGETARLMIQSPWEHATALLTVEREGIRSHSEFMLTSTQQTVTVPVTAADIPNLYVSVLLVKGRTDASVAEDTSDPGRPAFRLGYAKIAIEDSSKRLSVSVKANKEEYRPAGTAKVEVQVNDYHGAPAPSEVTLWAVDYGVLSLTAFRTPDVLSSVYVPKSLQVMTEDNRQRIISRRVLTPKGTDESGGGGVDNAVSQIRRDFRVLAFWLGSVATDSHGHGSADIKLPESLTTYRIMAVSGDKASRFGSGESEIRINKPVVLKAAFPRFLTRGDKAYFGSVVTSQLKEPGTAIVTMQSLDPNVLQITGETRRVVQVGAGASAEVRFDVVAKATGRARVQTTVRMGGEGDAFEDTLPVGVAVVPQSVAAYGEAAPDAKQPLSVPSGVLPDVGGLHLELASTALVGLGEGARYVVDYPFGCLEQRVSRTFVLAMAADLGDAFKLQGIDARDLRPRTQASLRELEKFQCSSGGFAFWPGACWAVSPFLTSYALHVFQVAAGLGYEVKPDVMTRGYDYLERELAEKPPTNEGWWPAYTAWEAFAVKVLADGGRNQDSNINRLYGYLDRMPVFAIAYLNDALVKKGESGPRVAELRRRMANAMLPEAGTSHVEELNDPYLLWFWNSNVRSTALVLNTLIRADVPQSDAAPLARWLVGARVNGRWNNTQENAVAMQALVAYYRRYEGQAPSFTAAVRLAGEDLVRASFNGRSAVATTKDVPMASLTRAAAPSDSGRARVSLSGAGAPGELSFHRDGVGTLYYSARLTYASGEVNMSALDNGFHIDRQYAPLSGGDARLGFEAGDLVRVTLSFDLPKERRYVAVTDPIPAGFEPVESWFATTSADLARQAEQQDGSSEPRWDDIWRRGTFDHVERHDDRVQLFATRLAEGHHEFSYVVRATTAGTFTVPPTRAEEMYAPEISGRTSTVTVDVKR